MTNGEKYKKAFSVLQTSKGSLQEVENMAKLQKRTKMKTAAAVIAGCIIFGGTGTAYAATSFSPFAVFFVCVLLFCLWL